MYIISKFNKSVNQKLGSSFASPAHEWGGQSSATILAAHFAKRNTKKYGGAEKRAGKNFYPVLAKQICGAFP